MSVVDNHQGSFPAADHMAYAYAGFAMHVHLAEIFKLNSQTRLGFESESGLSTCGHPLRFERARNFKVGCHGLHSLPTTTHRFRLHNVLKTFISPKRSENITRKSVFLFFSKHAHTSKRLRELAAVSTANDWYGWVRMLSPWHQKYYRS